MPFVRQRFAGKSVTIVDIGLGRKGLPLTGEYDLIMCTNVLEHTVNPDEIVRHFHDHLAHDGLLYVDFMNASGAVANPLGSENLLEAVEKRDQTITFLETHLRAIKQIKRAGASAEIVNGWDALGVYRKQR
jgi:2-polyprenyl-3-methyl-5-hydroxy-6-metoxy-1,4-benzoquinol methylase